ACSATGAGADKWFALPNFTAVMGLETGARLQLYTGSVCPVGNQTSISDLMGKTPLGWTSGRDLWFAFQYLVPPVVFFSAICILVLGIWNEAEYSFSIEQHSHEMLLGRWSNIVLTAWDAQTCTEEDQFLLGQSLLGRLRSAYEEETQTKWTPDQHRLVTCKRAMVACVNLALLVGLWVAMATSFNERPRLQELLSDLGYLGVVLAACLPNIVLMLSGTILPYVTHGLLRLEERSSAARVRSAMYRVYTGKVLGACIYIAFNIELMCGTPLFSEKVTLARDCQTFPCVEDEVAFNMLLLLVTEFMLTLLLKPLIIVARQYVAHFRSMGAVARLPEFSIDDFAVDIMYFQGILWFTQILVPTIAVLAPLLWFLHFKWLKFNLTRLTSRSFTSETTLLNACMLRILLATCLINSGTAFFFLLNPSPHEPGCGPFDSHQSPGMMMTKLDTPLQSVLTEVVSLTQRSSGSLLFVLSVLGLMVLMRLAASSSTNERVRTTFASELQRTLSVMDLRLFRLQKQQEVYQTRYQRTQSEEAYS
ncbi:unnamed protein product, partial [Polarella glacialis]